ncbi:MAG: hypothetical protein HY728_01115, partial [Candidatus Rokubacteria bacterium]|nr:hypothetical protein [Candidatus Rokubacteria bacterium]
TTAYILLAIQFEEHDLIDFYGDAYRNYRKKVPMIIPSVSAKDVGTPDSAPRAKVMGSR